MDLKAKNSITDRVQFTGIVISDEEWEREGSEPEPEPQSQSPVSYMGPERRKRREDPKDAVLSRTA